MEKITFKDIDSYIGTFSQETQEILQQIRATIKASAPDSEECISYGMPAFKQEGVLVYFAAYKNHIGFYAAPTGHAAFQDELSKYKSGKGSVQFPIHEPMPLQLISQIVKFKLLENKEKAALKKKKS